MMTVEPGPEVAAGVRTPVEPILAFVQSLNGELEPEQIMRRTVVAVAGAVGATQAGLAYVRGDSLLVKCFWRYGAWQDRMVSLPLHSSVSGLVARTGEPYTSNDVVCDAQVTPSAKRERDARTLLSLPLKGRSGATVAVLNLHDKHDGKPFDQQDIQIAGAYLPHAAAAVERAELFDAVREREYELDFLANHDPLTGLANRRRFLEKLETTLKSVEPAWICMALIDLDGLKDINETFGLHMGDQAIIAAARSLQRAIAPPALAARIGGDEYSVIAWGNEAGSQLVIEGRLRRVTARLGTVRTDDGRSLWLSGCLGIARGRHGCTSAELLAEAERALYQQKHAASPVTVCRTDVYYPRGRRAIAEELAALLQAASSLSAAGDWETLLRRLTEEAARIADAENGSVGLLQKDGGLGFHHLWRQGVAQSLYETVSSGDGAIGRVLSQLGVFRTEQAIGHSPLTQRLIARYKLRNLLLAPMVDPSGRPLGVVMLANKRGGRPFTEHDANLSRAFASLAGALVDNMRLRAETLEQSRQADEARRYYSALMEQAGEAVLVMDAASMTIIDVNQRAVELYGYSREEFLAFPPGWDIRSALERARSEGITHLASREGQVRTALLREHLRKDGSPFLVEVTANRTDTPRGPVVLSFIRECATYVIRDP